MTQRSIRNEADLTLLFRWLKGRKRPFTVEVKDGRKRSISQNSLQHLWIKEAAEQLGDRTPEELRGELKLTLGVPILREESEAYRQEYDSMLKPLPYEMKLKLMMEPFDMAVTRRMTVQQKTKYLERVEQFLLEQGCVLTRPEQRRAA